MKCAVLNVHATIGITTRKWKSATLTPTGPLPANTMMNRRKKKMSKLYKCPMWDFTCPYFCHRDKSGEGDFGLCLMPEMEGCSPVNECEAFDGVDEEDFEV